MLREGEFPKQDQSYPKRTLIRVLDNNGNPIPNTPVVWTVPNFQGRWQDGSVVGDFSLQTVTDSSGYASNGWVAPQYLNLGTSFSQTVATVSASGATAQIHFTTVAFQVDGFPNPMPSVTRIAPVDDVPVINATLGQTLPGALKYRFNNTSRLQGGVPLPNVGVSITTGNTPLSGPVVECVQGTIVLSDAQGVATCDLRVTGSPGTALITTEMGGGFSRGPDPYILLNVTGVVNYRLTAASGNNQVGAPNTNLAQPLAIVLDNGAGTPTPNINIQWTVTQGSASLISGTSVTDSTGRSTNGVRLGAQPGTVSIKATALTGTQPSVTFTVISSNGRSARVIYRDRYNAITLYDRSSGLTFNGGGIFTADAAAATNTAGDTFLTARDTFGGLWLRAFYSNQTWGPWLNAGGIFQGSPALALNGNGSPILVGRDLFDSYWVRTYTGFPGFSNWTSLGGIFGSDPAVTAIGTTYYITGLDKYGSVWIAAYTPGSPITWEFLGGIFQGKPTITAGPSGPIIAARDLYNNVWIYSATATNGDWLRLPGLAGSDPQLSGIGASPVLSVLDPASVLWYLPLNVTGNSIIPGSWTNSGGVLTDFAALNSGGQMNFFGRDTLGNFWFTAPGATPWTAIGPAGNVGSAPQPGVF